MKQSEVKYKTEFIASSLIIIVYCQEIISQTVNPTQDDTSSRMKESGKDEGEANYDLGLFFKILKKLLFCMGANAKIGVFLLISLLTEIVGLISDLSMIWLLLSTGFPYQALQLILSKANHSNIC